MLIWVLPSRSSIVLVAKLAIAAQYLKPDLLGYTSLALPSLYTSVGYDLGYNISNNRQEVSHNLPQRTK